MSGSGTSLRLGEILTLAEAAEYLRVDEQTLAKLAAQRGVPAQKIGEEWRFLRRALDDWLRSPSDGPREVLLPWALAVPVMEELMLVLEERLLDKLKSAAAPLDTQGSKQAVLKHFGIFKDDDDLEQQLAHLRASRTSEVGS